MQVEIGNNDLNPWLPGNGSLGGLELRARTRCRATRCRWTAPFRRQRRDRPLRRARAGLRDGQRHAARHRSEPQQPDEHHHAGEHRRARRPDPVAAPELGTRPPRSTARTSRTASSRARTSDNLEDHEPERRRQRHRHRHGRPPAADALADRLLAAAQANDGAVDQSTWSLSIQGGNGPSCTGTTRTVLVKGSDTGLLAPTADDHGLRHAHFRVTSRRQCTWSSAPTAPARSTRSTTARRRT